MGVTAWARSRATAATHGRRPRPRAHSPDDALPGLALRHVVKQVVQLVRTVDNKAIRYNVIRLWQVCGERMQKRTVYDTSLRLRTIKSFPIPHPTAPARSAPT